MQMVMTSDETQIQIFANWPAMSHAKRETKDNRKNPEYRVVAAIKKLRTDTNCPAGKSRPNHDPICCSFSTWFGHDFPAGQSVSVRSSLQKLCGVVILLSLQECGFSRI